MMTKYMIVTPEYGVKQPILEDGSGPTEYGHDVFECEAKNAREAKVLAVRHWREGGRERWVRDQLTDERNPFTGLKAMNMDLSDEEFNRRYILGIK